MVSLSVRCNVRIGINSALVLPRIRRIIYQSADDNQKSSRRCVGETAGEKSPARKPTTDAAAPERANLHDATHGLSLAELVERRSVSYKPLPRAHREHTRDLIYGNVDRISVAGASKRERERERGGKNKMNIAQDRDLSVPPSPPATSSPSRSAASSSLITRRDLIVLSKVTRAGGPQTASTRAHVAKAVGEETRRGARAESRYRNGARRCSIANDARDTS